MKYYEKVGYRYKKISYEYKKPQKILKCNKSLNFKMQIAKIRKLDKKIL